MKQRLYAPGPVEVPPAVLEAVGRPVFLHRGERFRELLQRVREKLATLACVPGEDVLVLTASGTAAFEAVLLAAVPRGSKVVSLHAGKFGERWAQMARSFGYEVVQLTAPWGQSVPPAQLEQYLGEHPDTAAVTTTHSETSTGVLHDVEGYARAVRNAAPETLLLVDAVTSLAAAELRPLEWGIDAFISGSQKGLLTPPGLAVAWLSERAWRRVDGAEKTPHYYLDLARERRNQAQGQTAFTPAVSLVAGLDVALDLLLENGVERLWREKERLNSAVLAGGRAMGMQQFAVRPSPAVAALRTPEGVAAGELVAALRHRGISISGGQDEAKEYLVRPSMLGWADAFDALTVVAALEWSLRDLGVPVPQGAGVSAAMSVLEQTAQTQSSAVPTR